MSISDEWVVVDTNVWIFGLRDQPDRPACAPLLRYLPRLYVKLPRQVLLELRANLLKEELKELFRLWRYYPDRVEIRWEQVGTALIEKYQQLGCKLGDAAVSAHLEAMGIKILVSENRHFLEEISGLPFRVVSSEDTLQELGETE
jgi:hypothetical protein